MDRHSPSSRRRALPAAAVCFLAWVAPAAAGCPAGTPGYRDGAGRCVPWQRLETTCGMPLATRCTTDDPDPAAADLLPTPSGDPSRPACRGCGCKGGPGYRSPQGRCVGWKDLSRICGASLPGHCTADLPDARADAIARQQAAIRARAGRR